MYIYWHIGTIDIILKTPNSNTTMDTFSFMFKHVIFYNIVQQPNNVNWRHTITITDNLHIIKEESVIVSLNNGRFCLIALCCVL